MENHDDDEANSSVFDPEPPLRRNQPREPGEHRTLFIRNREILRELMRLGESTGKTIRVLCARGNSSLAALTSETSVKVFHDVRQIHAIYGDIYPPFQNIERDTDVLVNLTGVNAGSFKVLRLYGLGDIEVKVIMRRGVEPPPPLHLLPAIFRKSRRITIPNGEDIRATIAFLAQEFRLKFRILQAQGKISDGHVYSFTRREHLTNLGYDEILQLVGDIHPNRTANLVVTLAGVAGGAAGAYRLIADGDVLVEVLLLPPLA